MGRSKRRVSIFFLCGSLLALASVGSMLLGSARLSPAQIMEALATGEGTAALILFDLRLPRLLAAVLAGAGLSAAGLLLQTVTGNELCAPSIIGVNAGAGLFVMATLCLFPAQWAALPTTAFAGALLTTFSVLAVAQASGGQERKSALVLSGVALSSLMNAGVAYLSLKYPDALSSYAAFSVGGFAGVRLEQLRIPAAVILGGLFCALLAAPKIHLLCLGDEAAASLGVNVKAVRCAVIVLSSALCAAVVSFAGLLGFVGLIVPHIVRRLCGGGMRAQLCLCALCGALIVALSDLIGRTAFAPWELPAGIIMALIGAPFFLYLIVRRGKR